MSKPIYIEFVGPAGAGKTTVCKQLITLLTHNGYKLESRKHLKRILGLSTKNEPRLYKIALFTLKHPVYTFKILLHSFVIVIQYRRSLLNNFQALVRQGITLRLLLSEEKLDLIVFDQGPIHKLQHLMNMLIEVQRFPLREKNLANYLESVFSDSKIVIVYLEINEKTFAKRIKIRCTESLPAEIRGKSSVEAVQKRFKVLRKQHLAYISKLLKDHSDTFHIALQGEDDVGDNVSQIFSFLSRIQ